MEAGHGGEGVRVVDLAAVPQGNNTDDLFTGHPGRLEREEGEGWESQELQSDPPAEEGPHSVRSAPGDQDCREGRDEEP